MEQQRLKTAVIGVGRWGKNIARELDQASELTYFASKTSDLGLAHVQRASVDDICADPSIRAVAIATPVPTHFEIASAALRSGKHVLCEKPLTRTSAEAHALAQLAQENARAIVTGYTLLYHPAHQEFKRLIKNTTPTRVQCVRTKYGTFTDTIDNALLTHYLSIAYDLFGMPQKAAVTMREAVETACDRIETVLSYEQFEFVTAIDRTSKVDAHSVTATFADGTTLSWSGTKLYKNEEVVFDNSDQALTREMRAFLDAAAGGPAPVSAGDFGARVLEIHEMLA
ncbi:MAG: Gfo/Idh/MocA family oxidoreductase [Candidatus Paceibacterota bacterium]